MTRAGFPWRVSPEYSDAEFLNFTSSSFLILIFTPSPHPLPLSPPSYVVMFSQQRLLPSSTPSPSIPSHFQPPSCFYFYITPPSILTFIFSSLYPPLSSLPLPTLHKHACNHALSLFKLITSATLYPPPRGTPTTVRPVLFLKFKQSSYVCCC